MKESNNISKFELRILNHFLNGDHNYQYEIRDFTGGGWYLDFKMDDMEDDIVTDTISIDLTSINGFIFFCTLFIYEKDIASLQITANSDSRGDFTIEDFNKIKDIDPMIYFQN